MVFNAFDTYCSAVCVMVRWKRYHAPITHELTAHMEDHADYLIAKGMEPDEAAAHAVAAMGDPYAVGKELDKLHSPWYPRLTRVFTVLAALLLLVSVVIGFNSNRFYPTFAPFADPTELLNADLPGTELYRGQAVGGGVFGAYSFSDAPAVLYKVDYTAPDGSPVYYLRLLLPAYTPYFWLNNPDPGFSPSRLDDAAYPYTKVDRSRAQGVFRRFACIYFPVEPPFRDSYTLEVGPNGEIGYTVTLEGVAMP